MLESKLLLFLYSELGVRIAFIMPYLFNGNNELFMENVCLIIIRQKDFI